MEELSHTFEFSVHDNYSTISKKITIKILEKAKKEESSESDSVK